MGWEEFLNYMTGPGVAAIVGFLLSFLVEMWPAYVDFESRIKRLVFMALCFVVPVLGTVGKCVSELVLWNDWEGAWWPALVAGALAYGAGQISHLRKLKWPEITLPVED